MIRNMFENFQIEMKKGISENEMRLIEKRNDWIIPDMYKSILKFSNGLSLDEGDVNLLGSGDIEEFNEDQEFKKYTPGYIGIGDTGGGYLLAMEQKVDANVIYVFGSGANFVGDEALRVDNVEKWFLNGCPIDQGIKIY